jgi:AmiR/NasT family two-component response regulator
MRLREQVIGALNLFGTETGEMSTQDVRIVPGLADVATIGLLQERALRHSEGLTEQLQAALDSRTIIEQAKGTLAQIHGGTPDQAFERLRRYSRRHRAHLSQVARAVLHDPGRVPDLTTPRP